MSELMTEIKNLGDQIQKSLEAATAAQSKADEIDQKSQATNDVVQKAVEASTKAMEEAQNLKQKIEAVEKTGEYIEKALARLNPTGGDSESKELESKAKDQMIAYMRTKTAIDEDVVEATCRALCAKNLHGISESRRETEIKTLMAGSNIDGGYWIRPERSSKMIQRIFETSPMRSLADVQVTNSDSMEFIIDDDEATSGGWVGETESRNETNTPKVGKLTIPIHEQFASPKATQKMLDDAGFDVENWLAGKVTRKMTRQENTAFVVGDGSEKPQGVLEHINVVD